MHAISATEFHRHQGTFLMAVRNNQPILLKSRYGNFKITPEPENDTLTSRICKSLKEVKLMETGQIQSKPARNFINEFNLRK